MSHLVSPPLLFLQSSVTGVVSLADMMSGGPNDDDASSTASVQDTAKYACPPTALQRTHPPAF